MVNVEAILLASVLTMACFCSVRGVPIHIDEPEHEVVENPEIDADEKDDSKRSVVPDGMHVMPSGLLMFGSTHEEGMAMDFSDDNVKKIEKRDASDDNLPRRLGVPALANRRELVVPIPTAIEIAEFTKIDDMVNNAVGAATNAGDQQIQSFGDKAIIAVKYYTDADNIDNLDVKEPETGKFRKRVFEIDIPKALTKILGRMTSN